MISGVVLAAGSAERFGGTKQLAKVGGTTLVQRAVDALVDADVTDVVVVVGHDAARVRAALRLPVGGRVVVNERYAEGQAASLATGLAALGPASDAAVVLLADQPGITSDHVRALVAGAAGARADTAIVRLRFDDGPGPALLTRAVFAEATSLAGDTGARAIIDRSPERVLEVRMPGPAPRDVDTRADLDAVGGTAPDVAGD